MITVGVGVEDGVNLNDAFAEALLAEVGWCVNLDVEAVVAKEGGGSEAAVTGVWGVADSALATDDGDSVRSACAQEDEFELAHGKTFAWWLKLA